MREMKDSGIEWIGNIPVSWKIVKVKYNFANKKVIAGLLADNYERLALTMNGVIKRSKEDNNGLQPEKFETYQVLNEGELVFKLIDLQNVSTSRVGLSPFIGLVSPAYIIIKRKGEVLSEFAEKFFLSMWKNQIFNAMGDSGVRSSLNTKDLLEIQMVFPSESEQKAIADYLDSRCTELDTIISDIQSQIETLEEYKRSVITEAVTKGIRKSNESTDTAIPWIKQMPTRWRLSRIKYEIIPLSRSVKGTDEVITCFRDGQVTLRKYRREEGFTISFTENGYQGVEEGDLVIHGMDTFAGAIGCSECRGKCTPVVHVCKTTGNNRYFMYYLRSLASNEVLWFYANGVRVRSSDFRNFSNLGKFTISVPPISEQNEIVEYLDSKCAEIDSIIAEKKQQIETIEEYKKSLIFEYVTGKKEVPIWK